MNEQDETTTTSDAEHRSRSFDDPNPIEAVKKVALAGLGAVAVATEATDEVFSVLVKKGEEAREEAVREFREARDRNAKKRAESETYVRARMDSILNRVNLASKGDVEALNAKLNIITRKLDEFQASRVPQSPVSSGFSEPSNEPAATPEPPADPRSV